jgi:hypothetical protein
MTPRPLTPRERGVLVALIERGTPAEPVTDADRARWLEQVPSTLAGRACDCGTSPSIELTDATGRNARPTDGRVVLEASAPDALLLLFVDDDRLSYLEVAPMDDDPVVLPDADDVD